MMIVSIRFLTYLLHAFLLYTGQTAAKKSKGQIQNILARTFGEAEDHKKEKEPLVLPWKKPTTVISYSDILTFHDEAEITDNHVCSCHLEEYNGDSIGASFEGAL